MKRGKAYIGLTAALFGADQLMKTYAEQNLDLGEERRMKGGVLIRRVHNKGFTLNLLEERPDIVRGMSLAVTIAMTACQILEIFRRRHPFRKAGLALSVAGAWSNTFDRVVRGHVVDYIGFGFSKKRLADITYNIGDVLLMAGGIFIMIDSILPGKKHRKKGSILPKKKHKKKDPILPGKKH